MCCEKGRRHSINDLKTGVIGANSSAVHCVKKTSKPFK